MCALIFEAIGGVLPSQQPEKRPKISAVGKELRALKTSHVQQLPSATASYVELFNTVEKANNGQPYGGSSEKKGATDTR